MTRRLCGPRAIAVFAALSLTAPSTTTNAVQLDFDDGRVTITRDEYRRAACIRLQSRSRVVRRRLRPGSGPPLAGGDASAGGNGDIRRDPRCERGRG